jgi:hypothetical protein
VSSNAPVIPYLFQNRTNPSGDSEENQTGDELQGGQAADGCRELENGEESLGSHNNHLNCAQDHSEESNHDYDKDHPQDYKSSDDCSHFSELADLAKNHVSQAIETQLSSEATNFSSLAQLSERHNKVNKLQVTDNDISSLAQLASRHRKSKIQAKKQFFTLTELASHHQQESVFPAQQSVDNFARGSQNSNTGSKKKVSDTMGSLEKTVSEEEVETDCEIDLTHALISPGSKSSQLHENSEPKIMDCKLQEVTAVENCSVVETLSEEEIEMDYKIDLTHALISPGSKSSQLHENSEPKIMDWMLHDVEQEELDDIVQHETPEWTSDFDASSKILNRKLPNQKKRSDFGRILCRKLKQLSTTCIAPREESLNKIVPFSFNTDSPDDKIFKLRRRKK